MKKFHFSALACSILILSGCGNDTESANTPNDEKQNYAMIHNFTETDLLDGDDGLAPNTFAPLKFGAPIFRVDDQGNGIEEHEATISYFNGKYYKYVATWGCGKLVYFSGRIPGVDNTTIQYPINLSGGKCGLASYSSDNLMNWHLEDFYSPPGLETAMAKPQVHWSKGLNKYVLWFKRAGAELAATGGLYYVTSDNPAGPWSEPIQATGDHLAHDFDIAFGADGKAYIATDVFSGTYDPDSPGGAKPLWNVWIQELNDDLTGTVGTDTSKTKMMSKVDFQAIGLFEKNNQWYLTGGPTCGNCQVPIEYISASTALGRWSNEAGQTGEDLKRGTVLNEDGCTGQNKGVSILPSLNGDVALAAIFGYRTNPKNHTINNKVVSGDNSQAISSTYWYPLQFDAQKRIQPLSCSPNVKVPLNKTVAKTESEPYQPDCRIRQDSSIQQKWKDYKVENHHLKIPVFQRTDDLGPYLQNGGVMNNNLEIKITYIDGKTQTTSVAPNKISWAPQVLDIELNNKDVGIQQVSLNTQATNGCYGVLVQPKKITGEYSRLKDGESKIAEKAQIFIKAE